MYIFFGRRGRKGGKSERRTRRPARVSQFYDGFNDLIYYARRYFQYGINYRWVDLSRALARLPLIVLDDDYLRALALAIPSQREL